MNMLKLCLESASQQFISFVSPELLSERAKLLMASAALALAAAAVVAPTSAQAQTWAGQTAASQANAPVLPQSSAGHWGDMLGGSIGRVLGASVGGAANSELGRRMQGVVMGVSEEVGRNVGRQAAQRPYQDSAEVTYGRSVPNNPFNRAQVNPRALAPATPAYSVPIATVGRSGTIQQQALSHVQDNLDLLALKAVVANDDMVRAGLARSNGVGTLEVLEARALANFEVGLRTAVEQGVNVQPWMPVRSALLLPVGTVSQQEFINLGRPMAERLNRSDGPGLNSLDLNNDRHMAEMRALNRAAQQNAVRSMPIENFGR